MTGQNPPPLTACKLNLSALWPEPLRDLGSLSALTQVDLHGFGGESRALSYLLTEIPHRVMLVKTRGCSAMDTWSFKQFQVEYKGSAPCSRALGRPPVFPATGVGSCPWEHWSPSPLGWVLRCSPFQLSSRNRACCFTLLWLSLHEGRVSVAHAREVLQFMGKLMSISCQSGFQFCQTIK